MSTRSTKGCRARAVRSTPDSPARYGVVVGLPIQPTTGGPAGRGPDRGTNRVVSTHVGMIVTAGLCRRAYRARYSLPTMTRVDNRTSVDTFRTYFSEAANRFASLVFDR